MKAEEMEMVRWWTGHRMVVSMSTGALFTLAGGGFFFVFVRSGAHRDPSIGSGTMITVLLLMGLVLAAGLFMLGHGCAVARFRRRLGELEVVEVVAPFRRRTLKGGAPGVTLVRDPHLHWIELEGQRVSILPVVLQQIWFSEPDGSVLRFRLVRRPAMWLLGQPDLLVVSTS